MAFEYLTNITAEEKLAARQAAQEERDRIIKKAINDGAKVQYMTSRLSTEEQETHISIGNGECLIDTTIPKDMTKCIKRGWSIQSVTYYKGTDVIAGMVFKGSPNKISILSD